MRNHLLSLSLLQAISYTELSIITNITDVTELNSQFSPYGSGILQPCSITTYFDPTSSTITPYNYLFLPLSSSNSSYSLSSNVYNSKIQQYKNPNNPTLSSVLPNQETSNLYFNGYLESFASCISPQTLDIIICYQQPQLNNEYNVSIQCNIFYNNKSSQTWSNAFKTSEYFFQQTFTNVVCFDNSYLILWANFIYYENSWVRYSIIDLNGNIKVYNIPLSLGNITHSFCWGWLHAIQSPFRNAQNKQIFLLEVIDESETQYAVSMFAQYNYNQSSTNTNDTIIFFNTPLYQHVSDDIAAFSLNYASTVIHQNDECCFLIPYTDSQNNTYVCVMNIFGDRVLHNDTLIVSGFENLWLDVIDLYDGYWMIIYDSFDDGTSVILNANIYLLTNVNNEYDLQTVETGIQLQKWYNKQCIFCANTISINNQTQLFITSSVGIEIASTADIYAQTFAFSPHENDENVQG